MPDLAFDLRYLQYALVVAECGSFRRAADMLNLSQSTVSRRVQLLERRIGAQIFERDRTGTRPTLWGELFIRDAAVGAESLRQAISGMATLRRGDEGELRIGIMGSLAQGPLGELIEAYRGRYPRIHVKIEEATLQANAAGVMNRRLDVAFIPGTRSPPGCEVRHFWVETLYVAVSTDHPLAAVPRVSWEDLRDEIFLITAGCHGPEVEGIVIRQASNLGFHPKISVQGVGRENLLNMVGKGYGLTVVASSTIGVGYPGVKFRPIDPVGETVTWRAAWQPNNRNPALMRLLELLAVHTDARVPPILIAR
ncbi:LysR family transcriptional regulator [Novosphingobium sp.]|uniref:LysR family transcriptional regulator n=1 Tax=Novosphingobium sp. TaxID=1874826 RepID=UPI002FDDBA60